MEGERGGEEGSVRWRWAGRDRSRWGAWSVQWGASLVLLEPIVQWGASLVLLEPIVQWGASLVLLEPIVQKGCVVGSV